MKKILSVFLSAIIVLSLLTMFTSCKTKDDTSSVNSSSELISDETEEFGKQELVKNTILKIEDNYTNESGFVDEEDIQPLIEAVLDETEKHKDKIEFYEEGSESVYIQFKNGLGYLYQPDIQGYQASGNNIRIVTMQPFYSEMSNTVTFKDPDKGAEAFCNNLSNASFDVKDNLDDKNVTIDSILNLKGSSVILWDGHGGYTKTIHSCLGLSIPFKDVKEKYPDDCHKRNIVEDKNGNAILTAGFFDEHFKEKDFENAVIYLGGCHTAEDNFLANVLISKGAKCVFGNTGKVLSNYNEKMIISVSEYLSKRKTASYALKEAQKDNTLSHLFFWSEVKLIGDDTFTFAKPADDNGTLITSTTNKTEPKQAEKNQENLTATESDFKKLEKLLNSDGGIIQYDNFNSKTASKYDFVRFAASSGFFPAYQTYFNDNMWSDNIINHEGYSEMAISANAFNWILKNIYNYKGNEIKETICDDKFTYITYKNNKFYYELPLDEAGLFGEFHYTSNDKKDGQYIIQFDFDGFEPYSDPEKTFIWKYTVKAELKEVDNVDGTKRIKIWSVYSIERNN